MTLNIRQFKNGDYVLVIVTALLVLVGLLALSSASSALAYSKFNDSFHFLKQQSIHALLGLFLFLFFSIYPYSKLRPFAFHLWIASFIMLVGVLIPGIGVTRNNVQSWIDLGFISFQPVEIVKLFLIIYLAGWFSEKGLKQIKDLHGGLYPFLFSIGILLGLIILQPDFGSMMLVFVIAMSIYFIAGASFIHLFYILAGSLLMVPFLIIFEPYRLQRLTSFLNPQDDLAEAGYHLHQALIAVGTGGWFGRGFGKSVQKFQWLPEAAGDSIFAVMAEELGFFFSLFVVGLFLTLIFRGLKIASNAPDLFGKLLAVGILSWIGFQAFFNIGAIIGLLPITGLPLPFISQGGTSLVSVLAGVGILFNISQESK